MTEILRKYEESIAKENKWYYYDPIKNVSDFMGHFNYAREVKL